MAKKITPPTTKELKSLTPAEIQTHIDTLKRFWPKEASVISGRK